ncbi:MAG TPA: branched-chain amino acid ABC transporter permease, partial [Sporichthya sp.]|nr:branched-chain amino acid ABC transporter permease [Sporichthya sp.]
LAIAVVSVLTVELVRATRLGRLLRATADSNVAVETLGINTTAARTVVFCVSGFFAAIAGGLLSSQVATVGTSSYSFFQSLIWVAVLVAAGSATLGGAALATTMLVAIPAFFTDAHVINYQTMFFGIGAILLAQAPNGLVGLFTNLPNTRLWGRMAEEGPARAGAHATRRRQRFAESTTGATR